MSNNFVGVRVKVPLRILDWREQLKEINSAMLELKYSLMPLFNLMVVLAMSYLPKYFRIQSQKLTFRLLGTGTLTNVPGPDVNMTLAGLPIGGLAVFMPLALGVKFGAAFLTYGGQLNLSISVDGSVCTEPELIVQHFVKRLDAIYQSVSQS